MEKKIKTRWFAILFMLFAIAPLFGQSKEVGLDSLYQRLQNENYRIDINRVMSATIPNTERFNPSGFVEVKDSVGKGELPFFGKAYQIGYGDRSGISFDGPIEKMKIEKKKKRVEVRFDVKSGAENYRLFIQFYPGGNASIRLTSNQREGSSYEGSYKFLTMGGDSSD